MQSIKIISHDSSELLNIEFINEINRLGQLSAIAQSLNAAITTTEKLRAAKDQKTIVLHSNEKLTGFLKYGYKNLYFYKNDGSIVYKENMLSLLDFYVEENLQRRNLGFQLFQCFLRTENIDPRNCAYDRPSSKLLRFLEKHYKINDLNLQPNKYAISTQMQL